MNENRKKYIFAWGILVIVFNLVVFVTPSEIAGYSKFRGAFWAGYLFVMVGMLLQFVCTWKSLEVNSSEKMFYKLPMLKLGYSTMIAMFVFGVAAMVIPNVPYWLGYIACLIILVFQIMAILKASAASSLIQNTEAKVKNNTSAWSMLIINAQGILDRAKSEEIKSQVKKVYEKLRFSDPVSNDDLYSIEEQIGVLLDKLNDAVVADDIEKSKGISTELIQRIQERNNKCMLYK
jgi:hypothetical protein